MGSTLSVLASVAILRNSFNEFIPHEIRGYLWEFSRRFSSEQTMIIKESHDGSTNHLFNAIVIYLGNNAFSASSGTPRRLTVGKSESIKVLTFGLDANTQVVDTFCGVPMKWVFFTDYNTKIHYEVRWYELQFHKRYTDLVKNKYFPYILEMSKKIKDQNRVVKFFTTRGGRDGWSSKGMNLDHPMTFDTLAMDGDLKEEVMEDLNCFIGGKEYYKKIGKVWKRGYLLYGPPGTGKSSLIAAMANHLNFDIYNLNLSAVNSDSALEYLLLHMANRSILVVEDIDCSIMLPNRQADQQSDQNQNPRLPQVTLSGLLNAIDGLLSCCGDERIIVFTTNYKDRIDPALLRAGRMDMHIYLSYCTFSTFKQLAANYLEIWEHDLFCQIEKLISEVQVSPADVAGELMKSKDPKISLDNLIRFLERKKSETISTEELTNRPEENGGDESHETATDAADNGFMKQNKVESPENGFTSLKVGKFTVKAELEPILEAVLSKYGDIASNSSLHSAQCRSSLLEVVCGIIQKLQETEFKNLTRAHIEALISSVHDLESVNLEVGWLHQRLNDILQALLQAEDYSTTKEDNKDKNEKPNRCNGQTLKLSKETDAKFHYFQNRSLVDGLL